MNREFVTDADKSAYNEFCRYHLQHFLALGDAPLHHYTTGERLIQIIEKGQLWATHVSCLNDSKEMGHSVDLLLNAIARRKSTSVDPKSAPVFSRMEELLRGASFATSPAFVICFSEKADDLSQWRAYGSPNNAYAIEFSQAGILRAAAEMGSAYLVKVEYGEDRKRTFFDDVVTWSEKFHATGIDEGRAPTPEAWTDEFVRYWLWSLSYMAPIFKDQAFSDEVERRLIYFLGESDPFAMRFVQRATMMSRHLPLTFGAATGTFPPRLPINRVMVGPGSHRRECQIAAGDLLKCYGYGESVPIAMTEIPFRTT